MIIPYLFEEGIGPFGEGFLLYVHSLILKGFDTTLLEILYIHHWHVFICVSVPSVKTIQIVAYLKWQLMNVHTWSQTFLTDVFATIIVDTLTNAICTNKCSEFKIYACASP